MRTQDLLLLMTLIIALLLGACEKDPIEHRLNQDPMIITEDPVILGERVNVIDGGQLMPLFPVDGSYSSRDIKSETVGSKYEIYLRAEVDPPVHDGKTLQASHIRITGDHAFVTYNRQGPEFLGGVDVFDITDIENPLLIQSVIFPEKDISSIDVDVMGSGQNNFIYLTGAYNPDFDDLELASPAVVERFIANKSNMFMHLEEPRQFLDLPSFAGNDVRYFHAGNQVVYATSGSGGGLTILNNGMQQTRFEPISYARSTDTDGDHLIVYSAEGNRLIVMDMSGNLLNEIVTGGEHFINGEYLEAKSIVRLKDDLAFVAAGTGGVEAYDINTGSLMGYLPRPIEYEQADTPLNYVTNGVSVNEKLVLAANGGSGIHIAELDDTKSNILRPVGKFMFEYGSSANFVESSGNKVFVATGKGGLKILEIVEIEPTEPCETILERIAELFPETMSIHEDGHPASMLSDLTLPGTIELTADAPVYVTFVHNGAGWQNTFGYFAYHKDDPPASADDLDKRIIYSFVNENTNGEPRIIGERTQIGSDGEVFEEGTVIGFYVVAKGFEGGTVGPGKHTVYSIPEFNPGEQLKHVLFYEQSCLDIVLGFEDMLDQDGSDEDFNDIIFIISNGDDQFGNQTNEYINVGDLPIL
jgi:hypothetical protein